MIALATDENVSVTAGIGGFVTFFVLAIALWLLMRNMFARLRRMRYREEARIEAERRAAGLDDADGTPGAQPDDAEGPDDDQGSDGSGSTPPAGA